MNIVHITFDSNVWPIVVSPNPDKFVNEQALPSFQTINSSIINGYAKGFLAETVFTLEAVKKVDRRKFIQDYNPLFTFQENSIGLTINIAPDKTSHPGNNTYLSSDLRDALGLEFRVLPCPRFGWIKNPDLQDQWFTKLTDAEISSYEETFGEVVNKIKNCRCGSYDLEQIGKHHTSSTEHWINGIKNAPASEDKPIAKTFAEWADGDAIAAHIAYRNHYFCTRDIGKSAGNTSVMSENNRKWLEKDYGIQFVSPEDLAQIFTA